MHGITVKIVSSELFQHVTQKMKSCVYENVGVGRRNFWSNNHKR